MADYICPMCDTSVSRTDRACPKCGCPIDFIRDFQANKKTNTSEITPVQTDDFLELPIIKPVQKAENSNIPSPVQEESKPDLSKCKGIANRQHDNIKAPVPAIADGGERLKYELLWEFLMSSKNSSVAKNFYRYNHQKSFLTAGVYQYSPLTLRGFWLKVSLLLFNTPSPSPPDSPYKRYGRTW